MRDIDKNIRQYDNKGQKHGYWEVYWAGKLNFKSFFQNDKLVGYEEFYDSYINSKLSEKVYHI